MLFQHDSKKTMIDLLAFQTDEKSDKALYTFLINGIEESSSRTYGALQNNAMKIGGEIQKYAKVGQRVLLLFPADLSYIDAFWGTLYSGAIAVTAYPPSFNAKNERLRSIVDDCRPTIVLTNKNILSKKEKIISNIPLLGESEWISIEEILNISESRWIKPDITAENIAFLQYTSGSTSVPKGVMVTHKNILTNESIIHKGFDHDEDSTVLGWLPMYHDMGLIGNILQPVYAGSSCYLMSPFSFLKKPVVWLEAISKYKAHTSGGPSFAYDYLIKSVKEEDLEKLDLSCWKIAFNGSEPIRYSVMKNFEEKYKRTGFSGNAFYPCYGLAESTLFVTGGNKNEKYQYASVCKNQFEKNIVSLEIEDKDLDLVSSGFPKEENHEILIVDPETKKECNPSSIGEIWLAGDSVALGYWNNKEKTEEDFNAFTLDSKKGPFLRTGDLGFFNNGELYVSGRIKELIIIRGKNYYPQDIEQIVELVDSSLKRSCGAAFSVNIEGEEQLIVTQEIKNRIKGVDPVSIIKTIREQIIDKVGVDPYDIQLVRSASIPKTTSGKIQRIKCRQLYLSDSFSIVESLRNTKPIHNMDIVVEPEIQDITLEIIQNWIIKKISLAAGLPGSDIVINNSLTSYGFDSIKNMILLHEIEEEFSISIPVNIFFELNSITNLINKINELKNNKKKGVIDAGNYIPLSPIQNRLWFMNSIIKEKHAYNIATSIKISGKLNIDALKVSIKKIQDRHNILKTKFIQRDDQIVHEYSDELEVNLDCINLSTMDLLDKKTELLRIEEEKQNIVFSLETGFSWCGTLVKLSEDENYLILVVHHLIADGWSLNIFIEEISNFYTQFVNNGKIIDVELPCQYTDLINNEGSKDKKLVDFWKSKLDEDTTLFLPFDKIRPSVQTYNGSRYSFDFSIDLTNDLLDIAKSLDVSLFIILLTAFKVLLYRYTNNKTINVGTPVANRDTMESGKLIGLFMDSLVVSSQIDDYSFKDFVEVVNKNLKDGIANKDLSFAEIVKELNPTRNPSVSPFFQIMFILQNAQMDEIQVSDLLFLPRQLDNKSSKFDLTLELYKGKEGLNGWFEYNSDLFSESTIKGITDNFIELIYNIIKNPVEKIRDINILSKEESKEIINDFNKTEKKFSNNKSVHLLFEEQVNLHPNKNVIICGNEKISYNDLNRKANQIANFIISKGNVKGNLVGIYLNRSIEMVATVLGVLKAGLGYIPMDPNFPEDRLKYMVDDSGVETIICNDSVNYEPFKEDRNIIDLTTDKKSINQSDILNPDQNNTRINTNNIAYVIYTSGSTGNPKGVEIEHHSLTNFLLSMIDKPGISSEDTLLAVTTLSFDISKLEIFLPLIVGAEIVIASREDIYSGRKLGKLIEKHNVSIIQGTPATWKMLIESGWSKTTLKALCGGEALSRELAEVLLSRTGSLWNMYGPTETTIWSSVAEIKMGFDAVSIGTPIANTVMYIIDSNNHIAPKGSAGELCIGGLGLARGYLGQSELTNKSFININVNGEKIRVFKTGDLVRFSSTGSLEFFNRIDNQIKLRGYRIELGEIESVIKKFNKISDCIVHYKEIRKGDKNIVAYYISKNVDISLLKKEIGKKLPEYMIPSYFVEMDSFPITPNGKIDKKNLPDPETQTQYDKSGNLISESNTEIEEKIIGIWEQVLNRKGLNILDNFFDVGGHSLLLGNLHSKLENAFGIDFELLDLFEHTNIKSQAKFFMEKKGLTKTETIEVKKNIIDDDIAIIGLSCRVPGASTQGEFLSNLKDGVESIYQFTDEELLEAGVDSELLNNKDFVKAWGKLDDIECFDSDFFSYTPREAEIIDPQQRVFLEECYKTLEDGGYSDNPEDYKIGIFAGTGMNSYLDSIRDPNNDEGLATDYQYMISNDKDFLSTRVAYKLNLKGPAITVQTACSTSLVAVHLACSSLKNYEADMVLAGGVSIRLPQDRGYLYQEGMILSPDGHCRAFDANANGTVGGNGAGVVLLKRYQDAKRDGDNIYAVIKGSAINNDGHDKIGYTAPSISGQQHAIKDAINNSGIPVESLAFIENHGTGTKLGDPIEINALKKVVMEKTDKKDFCALTSVKTNIGHLDSAAGVIGLIKSALSLKNGIIPASLNFNKINPKIDLENSPFYVNSKLQKWDSNKGIMRCGISSFGIGGTNAHVVLEQHPIENNYIEKPKKQLITLSANSEITLKKRINDLGRFLETDKESSLSDIAFTLFTARKDYKFRSYFVTESKKEGSVIALKENPLEININEFEGKIEKLVFLFPGQGSQYVNMAKDLYNQEKEFQKIFDKCSTLIKTYSGIDILDIVYPEKENNETDINKTNITQPLLFALEYSLATFLISLGLKPAAMLGHSLGEYVCACVAGVFSIEDAIKLVVFRSQLMNSLPGGGMIAVFESEEKTEKILIGSLSIAVVNSPKLTVVSGTYEDVDSFSEVLESKGIMYKKVKTSHAFHSYMMENILTEFGNYFSNIVLSKPQIPYISNVTGTWIKDNEAIDPDYWKSHLRNKVKFSDGIKTLNNLENHLYVEVGPGTSIGGYVRQHDNRKKTLQTVRRFKDSIHDHSLFLSLIGNLWSRGQKITLNQQFIDVLSGSKRKKISLPPYSFEKNKYWKKSNKTINKVSMINKRKPVSQWFNIPSWNRLPINNDTGKINYTNVLIFSDQDVISESITESLISKGKRIIPVYIGDSFEERDNSYIINIGNPEDYIKLFDILKKKNILPELIIHSLNLSDLTCSNAIRERAFYSLLFLTKGIGRYIKEGNIELIILSNNTHMVTGSEDIITERSLLNGPIKVISQEYPGINCRNIDFSIAKPKDFNISKNQFINEIEQVSQNQFIAYRGIFRWVLSFSNIQAPKPDGEEKDIGLNKDGVYLITGGTGGLGLVVAKAIAEKSKSKLILSCSSDFPEREKWDELSLRDGILGKKLVKIKELESLGSKVMVVKANVVEKKELFKALGSAEETFGTITGVFHAAGIPGGGLIELKTREEAEKILSPKVDGTINIDSYFKDKPLNFLILFSSVTSICGGIGQIDYASGNAFLDAFALNNQNRNYPVISLNWDTWKETGMAISPNVKGYNKDIKTFSKHPIISKYYEISESHKKYFGYISEKDWVLKEHWIMGKPTLPGTVYIELVNSVFQSLESESIVNFKNIYFLSPLIVQGDDFSEIIVDLINNSDEYEFVITSRLNGTGPEITHSRGTIVLSPQKEVKININEIEGNCNIREINNPEDIAHLAKIRTLGDENNREEVVEFGARWKNISWIKLGEDDGLCSMLLPQEYKSDIDDYFLHPSLLDCAVAFLRPFKKEGIFLPLSYSDLSIYGKLTSQFYSYVKLLEQDDSSSDKGTINFSVSLYDLDGKLLLDISRFTMREIDLNSLKQSIETSKEIDKNPVSLFQKRLISEGISNNEGIRSLWTAMELKLPQQIISTYDFDFRMNQYDEIKLLGKKKRKKMKAEDLHPRPDLKNAYVAPRNETEVKVADIWKELLGIREVGIQDDIFELGVHSLLIVEFHKELKEVVETEISVVDLYKYKTVESLVEFLSGNTSNNQVDLLEKVNIRADMKKEAKQRRKKKKRQ